MSPAPKWPYVLLAVLAVLVVVAVLLIVLHPWSSSTSDPAVGADDAAVTAQPAADAQVGEQGTDVAEPSGDGAQQAAASPVFASLSELYGRLSGYDASISSVATDFNNNYLSADQSLRQSYADQAASLLSSISADYEAVKALAVAEDSPYYNTWQNNVTLYDCLYNRARVLSEAWDLSAQAADPSSVQDDISRVLGADNDSSGVNTYKTKYNTLYPASEPQQQ
jgi:hypothetical protein